MTHGDLDARSRAPRCAARPRWQATASASVCGADLRRSRRAATAPRNRRPRRDRARRGRRRQRPRARARPQRGRDGAGRRVDAADAPRGWPRSSATACPRRARPSSPHGRPPTPRSTCCWPAPQEHGRGPAAPSPRPPPRLRARAPRHPASRRRARWSAAVRRTRRRGAHRRLGRRQPRLLAGRAGRRRARPAADRATTHGRRGWLPRPATPTPRLADRPARTPSPAGSAPTATRDPDVAALPRPVPARCCCAPTGCGTTCPTPPAGRARPPVAAASGSPLAAAAALTAPRSTRGGADNITVAVLPVAWPRRSRPTVRPPSRSRHDRPAGFTVEIDQNPYLRRGATQVDAIVTVTATGPAAAAAADALEIIIVDCSGSMARRQDPLGPAGHGRGDRASCATASRSP